MAKRRDPEPTDPTNAEEAPNVGQMPPRCDCPALPQPHYHVQSGPVVLDAEEPEA